MELCLWISRYKSIYEMDPEDKPDSELIENDKELDAYLDDLYRKRLSERLKNRK